MKNFSVSQEVPIDKIANLLCSALEGGSNYWYMLETKVKPEKLEYQMDKDKVFPHIDYPLNEGGALIFSIRDAESDDEKRARYTLNRAAIATGLEIMSRDYSRHFGDMMSENDDAETGDVFLQCCLFGKLIYG